MCSFYAGVLSEIDFNTINDDGSYRFRHTNDDIGSFYHSASASPDNIVRGRYGSRNPATGQIEETVYTAGPRGFRANGPKIHRKTDLAQYPVRPRGSPDDPLADPYDDPSYSFSFRTADHSRSEDSNSSGRVRGTDLFMKTFIKGETSVILLWLITGLYSYLDDVGERHSVRYAAGAGTGFEVSNAIPDNPARVGYTLPLYKAHPKTRGKITVQRGPDGAYKLIAAGPDHRRAESRASDGLVHGTYSFLDDKGVQRTVEYIAGAGIGYRVVQNRVGPGTHINPSVSDFRLSDTDFRLANDFGRGAGGGLRLGGSGLRAGSSDSETNSSRKKGGSTSSASRSGVTGNREEETEGDYLKTSDPNAVESKDRTNERENQSNQEDTSSTKSRGNDNIDRQKTDRIGTANRQRGDSKYRGGSSTDRETMSERDSNKISDSRITSNRNSVSTDQQSQNKNRGSSTSTRGSGYSYQRPSSSVSSSSASSSSTFSVDNYNLNDDDVGGSLPPLITANRKILELDRERDWVERHRDSTVIKNVGKWYIGLPPGQSVRAHVQNIDVIPLGGRRVPSPSEALRQDEIADMNASLEDEPSSSYSRS
uniref:Cuticle protein 6 n=1 Tax=Glossina brevipalpis TaxID=37001 RepID=A0A1A9W7H6_9MUSC